MIAIKIENLSKQYRLGLVSTRTLSHDLNRWYQTTIRGKEDPYLKIGESASERRGDGMTDEVPMTPKANDVRSANDYFWALRDINLEVRQGEVLGIIGKNGAGKSTLLKILSKVTAPTTGTIKAKGRIASLLEVGTGFHPEMTGRENIYMNGAIMGMTKAEISRKLDEIVDFAGVETFIDTPVKRYSSGMIVRLGFAVAAHLEPEILVVDEVLAVGDAEFQKRAIGKMQEVSKNEGRTVLLVSHNMGAVRSLCEKTLLLQNGRQRFYSITEEAINLYIHSQEDKVKEYIAESTSLIYLSNARLLNTNFKTLNVFDAGEKIFCEIILKVLSNPRGVFFAIALLNKFKNRIFSSDHPLESLKIKAGREIRFKFEFPNLPYAPGLYSLNISLHIPNVKILESHDDILPFEILDKGSVLSKYKSFTGDMLVEGKILI